MPEDNPEDSFTFVDKRKINAEAVTDEPAPPPVFDTEQVTDDDESTSDPVGVAGLASYVVGMLASDAWAKMGLIADPSTGKVDVDLNQARLGIDCVAALVGVLEKQSGSMPGELLRDLQRVLSDLRLNYVEQARRNQS